MVKFKSRFDKKYLSDGLKAHIRVRLKIFKYIPFVGIGYFLFIVLNSVFENNSISLTIFDYIMIVSITLFPFLFYYLNKLNFKDNSLFGKDLNWEISPEYIRGFNENLNFNINWKNVLEVYKIKNGLIIYPNKNSYYWFPNSDLKEDNSVTEILEFVKNNNVKYFNKG